MFEIQDDSRFRACRIKPALYMSTVETKKRRHDDRSCVFAHTLSKVNSCEPTYTRAQLLLNYSRLRRRKDTRHVIRNGTRLQ